MRKTVIPTRSEAFFRKRVLGVLSILFITFVILLLSFIVCSCLLVWTSFSESNIYIYVLITAIASPLVGSFIGGVMHKRSMFKRNLVANEKESSSEEFKNILIALLIYFALLLFL